MGGFVARRLNHTEWFPGAISPDALYIVFQIDVGVFLTSIPKIAVLDILIVDEYAQCFFHTTQILRPFRILRLGLRIGENVLTRE